MVGIPGSELYTSVLNEFATAGVSVRLDDPSKNTGEAVGDSYNSIEAIVGSNFDDYLRSSSKGGEQLEGLSGDDVLLAGQRLRGNRSSTDF